MVRSSELLGTPVITVDEGLEAGKVIGFLVNTAVGEIAALAIGVPGRFEAPKAVPFPLILGIGENAVMIENMSSLADFSSLPDLMALGRSDSELRGIKAMTRSGKQLGIVADFGFDPSTGKIVSYDINNGDARSQLSAEFVITIGANALITAADANSQAQQGPAKSQQKSTTAQ